VSEVRVVDVVAEHRPDGLGIGVSRPRLSWRSETDAPSWMQASCEIRVLDADTTVIADTGVLETSESLLVPWPGDALASRQRRSVQVRVTGTDGSGSEWSEPLTLEVGLLDPSDWSARFVGPDWYEELDRPQPCPFLRREFALDRGVVRARLYVTALGVYDVELNGVRVGDHVLAPGWSSYHHRLRYDTFDVTGLVDDGANAIGGVLGDGWYRGSLVDNRRRNRYGNRLALLCQLEITHTDGSVRTVVTDEDWRATTGPVLATGIYEGETHDARLELDGWSRPGFDDSAWKPVGLVEHDLATLVAREGPPVRVTERVQPAEILTSPSGRCILDFGQNLVGRLELAVDGPAGSTITVRHAEVLQDGELCTEPLRSAEATDRYTLRGDGVEVWQPRFTFHGFRFAEVDGWPGAITPSDVAALVLHSDMRRTGWFECSDERVNRLHENIVWGMRGNFLDLPTDCPQRDERLGWTGDINVFAPTASYLYDCAGFLASWLRELAADQLDDGVVPWVVPQALDWVFPAAVWGDAAVTVPFTVYERFGDAGVLRAQYPSMRAWVEHVIGLAGEEHLWKGGFQFGDWLDPTARDANPFDQRTDPELLATAVFSHSLDLMADAAGVLAEHDDEQRYRSHAGAVRAAFASEYVTPNGRLASDAQTAYSLAVVYDLLANAAQRDRAGQRLRKLVHDARYTIATGFVGTPLICDALTDTGHLDAAYGLLLQEECPSWLYPVLGGATTIWERWDSITPDGRVNEAALAMLSFNHYAFGAVGDWLHRVVGGLAPGAPGYRHLVIAPRPGGGITAARSRHETPYGTAESSWQLEDGELTVRAVVPPNTVATVVVPGGGTHEVGSGAHEWRAAYAAPPAVTVPPAGARWQGSD
jgi:alpha-L-rhamnosidase